MTLSTTQIIKKLVHTQYGKSDAATVLLDMYSAQLLSAIDGIKDTLRGAANVNASKTILQRAPTTTAYYKTFSDNAAPLLNAANQNQMEKEELAQKIKKYSKELETKIRDKSAQEMPQDLVKQGKSLSQEIEKLKENVTMTNDKLDSLNSQILAVLRPSDKTSLPMDMEQRLE